MAENKNAAVEQAPAKEDKKVSKYETFGLRKSDNMPLEFEGVMYNLANLTDEQADYLISKEIPFIRAK